MQDLLENKSYNALLVDQPSLFNTCSTLPSGTPEVLWVYVIISRDGAEPGPSSVVKIHTQKSMKLYHCGISDANRSKKNAVC